MASTEDADDLFLTISDVLDNSKKQSSSSTRQKGSSLCTYYDGGNSGPSLYNSYQLVGNKFIRVEKLGNKLLGKPIRFTEISHDN